MIFQFLSNVATITRMLHVPMILAIILISFAIGDVSSEDSQYTTKYDNVDLEQLVKNERLLKNYVDCLLEKGSCSPDGLELRNNMPDAIASDCSKCSLKQKEGSEFIIKFLIDNKPDYWESLEEKYDPSGDYKKKYLESKHSGQNDESATRKS